MPDPTQEALEEIRASIAALEQRIYSIEYHWQELHKPAEAASAPLGPKQAPAPQPVIASPPPIETAAEPKRKLTIEDLLSPRRLAWLGGAVLVAGVAFLVSIGIQDGWITPTMQLIAALIVCLGLSSGGFWLYEQRDQGHAAMAMFGAGIAGFYATLVVATQTYDFIDPLWLGLVFAGFVAAAGTRVALRWDSQPMAALALLGAVASPVLLGMSEDLGAVFFTLVAYAAIAVVSALQNWRNLAVASVFFALFSAIWVFGDPSTAVTISTALIFWLLTVIALYGATALGKRTAKTEEVFDWSAAVMFTGVTSLVALLIGVWISEDWPLWEATRPDRQVAVWLIGFAALNFLLALGSRVIGGRMRELEFNALMVGFVLLTVGLAYAFSGPTLVVAFAVEAIVIAIRFRDTDSIWAQWAPAPLIALCIIHILDQEVPPELLEKSAGDIAAAQLQHGVAAILATVVAAASWAWFSRESARAAAVVIAEVGVIYLMLLLLDGIALVAALCALAAAAAYVGAERGKLFGLVVPGIAFGTALLHVIFNEANLVQALSTGVDDPLIAGAALLMIAAVAGFWASLAQEREVRMALTGVGLASLVLLGSVEIVSAFQPDGTEVGSATDFGSRQRGQALLSGFWAIAALAGIVYGLLNSVKEIRYAGLGLLAIAVGKIMLFDLTSLDAAYRTGSFIAVGAMLLLAAFAYQNVKERVTSDSEPADQ